MIWNLLTRDANPEVLGYLPSFLSENDTRSAREQFDDRYISGWNPFPGFKMADNYTLTYPGDPAMRPLAMTMLRDEAIYVYRYGWVAVVQPDKSFECARLD